MAQVSKRPPADSVIAACEEVRDMGVETLDALAGSADTAGRARAVMVGWDRSVAFSAVGVMRHRDVCRIDFALG